MKKELEISSLEELGQVAEMLLAFCDNKKVITFTGEIGAGKTTLITVLCQQLGVKDMISSPTFSIVNEYENGEETLYHIDLYRLPVLEEAIGIGIEDYIYSGRYCFIEWPGLIDDLLDEKEMVQVFIETLENGNRRIVFFKTVHG
jgi:tRNA threonylcarbamoyladenosine biosynthesis protein TsaE